MMKHKIFLFSLATAIIGELIFNLDLIMSWFYTPQEAVITLSEGLYKNENDTITVVPDLPHEIYVNNLNKTPYSLTIEAMITSSQWELTNIPFNIYGSNDGEHYEWSCYQEIDNKASFLYTPSPKGRLLKMEVYLPDYTEFNLQVEANTHLKLDINLLRLIFLFLIFYLIITLYVDENKEI